MPVEPRESLERRLDILCGNIADLLCLEDLDEPPVAVRVVHEHKRVALEDIGLAVDGRGERVQRVDEVEVDALVGDGELAAAVVVDVVLVSVVGRVVLEHGVVHGLGVHVPVPVHALLVAEHLPTQVKRVLPMRPVRLLRHSERLGTGNGKADGEAGAAAKVRLHPREVDCD